MARRKEVFQSKVLQRLYPAALQLEKEPSPSSRVEVLAKKVHVKRKGLQENTATGKSAANPGRRMYTVLPPPADYKADLETFAALSQPESINNAEDPAEKSVHDSNEEVDHSEEEEEQQKRKKRRKKRKPPLDQASGTDGAAPVRESSSGQSQMPVNEGGECISRNKKRKLKKKRHKEKLLSMGLMPRAAALEFTYKKDGEVEDEKEDSERRAAEVSDFLRTTMEIYTSDSSLHANKPHLLSGTLDDLLGGIASGCRPTAVLKQLYYFKTLIQQKETDKLEKALEELKNMSPMSAEETAAVVSLFQYWITDILPMQGDKKTGLSTTHPRDCQSHRNKDSMRGLFPLHFRHKSS